MLRQSTGSYKTAGSDLISDMVPTPPDHLPPVEVDVH